MRVPQQQPLSGLPPTFIRAGLLPDGARRVGKKSARRRPIRPRSSECLLFCGDARAAEDSGGGGDEARKKRAHEFFDRPRDLWFN